MREQRSVAEAVRELLPDPRVAARGVPRRSASRSSPRSRARARGGENRCPGQSLLACRAGAVRVPLGADPAARRGVHRGVRAGIHPAPQPRLAVSAQPFLHAERAGRFFFCPVRSRTPPANTRFSARLLTGSRDIRGNANHGHKHRQCGSAVTYKRQWNAGKRNNAGD